MLCSRTTGLDIQCSVISCAIAMVYEASIPICAQTWSARTQRRTAYEAFLAERSTKNPHRDDCGSGEGQADFFFAASALLLCSAISAGSLAMNGSFSFHW
jgi:hypothetical protein